MVKPTAANTQSMSDVKLWNRISRNFLLRVGSCDTENMSLELSKSKCPPFKLANDIAKLPKICEGSAVLNIITETEVKGHGQEKFLST